MNSLGVNKLVGDFPERGIEVVLDLVFGLMPDPVTDLLPSVA